MPYFLKWVGVGITALSFFSKKIILGIPVTYYLHHPVERAQFGANAFIIGLFLIAFSKEKEECDTMNQMRLKAMAQAIVIDIFLYFILFSNGEFGKDITRQAFLAVFIILFLIMYIPLFLIKKFKNTRNEKLDKRREGEEKDDPGSISESIESVETLD